MVKDVMSLFQNTNPETFCDEISACDNGLLDKTHVLQSVSSGDNQTCTFCQDVVTNVKQIISSKDTEAEVKSLVDNFCRYLGSLENECVSLTDDYLDQVFDFIRTSLQPLKFCQSIGACAQTYSVKKDTNEVADLMDVVNIFPAGMTVEIPDTPLETDETEKKVETEGPALQCVLCKKIVAIIIADLKDNRTEEEIIQALDNVCKLFPKSKQDECDTFVQQYTEELIHILTEETDPEMACTLLGVCVPMQVRESINREREETKLDENESERSDSIEWTSLEPAEKIADIKPVGKKQYCVECELVMHFLQDQMYDFDNEQEVETFVEEKLCNKMRSQLIKEACDDFVKEYGQKIMKSIAQKVFDPTKVCKDELKLCGKKLIAVDTTDFVVTDQVKNEKCDLCISLVTQIDSLLESDVFDKELATVVEKVCEYVPTAKQEQCKDMVEAYLPYFLQMIGHMSDAHSICKSIDMCYTPGHTQLLGGSKCSFGPSYWCHSIAHAEACKATPYCQTKVWKPIE